MYMHAMYGGKYFAILCCEDHKNVLNIPLHVMIESTLIACACTVYSLLVEIWCLLRYCHVAVIFWILLSVIKFGSYILHVIFTSFPFGNLFRNISISYAVDLEWCSLSLIWLNSFTLSLQLIIIRTLYKVQLYWKATSSINAQAIKLYSLFHVCRMEY